MPNSTRMMEKFFGPEGSLAGWIVPANAHHVVLGYVDKDRVAQVVAAVKAGKPGLADDVAVATTAALLPFYRSSVFYMSPAGMVDFVKQMAPAVVPGGTNMKLKLPEFPKTPPIGLAIAAVPNELHTSLVIPAEVLHSVAEYAAKLQAMRHGGARGQ